MRMPRTSSNGSCAECHSQIYGGVYCRECSLEGHGPKEERDSWLELERLGNKVRVRPKPNVMEVFRVLERLA